MSLNKHERFIRSKLKDQKVDLDKDALWAAVKQQPKRDNKKYFFILLFLGIASIGFLFINQHSKSEELEISANSSASASAIASANSNSNSSASPSANANANANKSNPESKENFRNEGNTINDQDESNSSVSQTVKVKAENSIGKNDMVPFIIERGATSANLNSNANSNIVNNSISEQPINDNPLTNNLNTQLLNNYKTQDSNDRMNTLTNITTEQKSLELFDFSMLHSLTLLNQFSVPSEFEFDASNMIQAVRSKKLNVELDLEFGTGIIFQSLRTNDPDLAPYLNSIKTFEKPLDYYHSQLGIKLNHNSLPFYLKTGISYSRISSRIQLISTTYTDTIINGTQYYDVDSRGARSAIDGDIMAVKVTDYRAKWHTYHHMIDIPIVVGYNLIKTPTIGLSLEGGLTANILNHSQGAYINQEGFLNKFTNSDNDHIYNKNLGLNFQAGLDFRFLLTRQNSFSLRANWTQLGQMTNRQSEIIKKYQVLGINLGIQHRL